MTEGRAAFAEWVGHAVRVDGERARLEEVTEWGVVVRVERGITWGNPETGEGYGQAVRSVSEFRPWAKIDSIRRAEPEER